MDGAQHLKHW